jgi:hypothetical protein
MIWNWCNYYVNNKFEIHIEFEIQPIPKTLQSWGAPPAQKFFFFFLHHIFNGPYRSVWNTAPQSQKVIFFVFGTGRMGPAPLQSSWKVTASQCHPEVGARTRRQLGSLCGETVNSLSLYSARTKKMLLQKKKKIAKQRPWNNKNSMEL